MKEIHEREVNRLSHEITQLRQDVASKEGAVCTLQRALADKGSAIERLMHEFVKREASKNIVRDNSVQTDVVDESNVRQYQREISQLTEHIASLESNFSKAVSQHKSQHERDIRTLSEERTELYTRTLETVHSAFREALNSPDISELLPTQFTLPLFEYYPSPNRDPLTEFSSVFLSYMREALLSVLRPLCVDNRSEVSSTDSDTKVQHAVSLALEHAKRQYIKSFSDLKSSLVAKYTDKMSSMSEEWQQERSSLNERLDKSRESGLSLKRRLQDREMTTESERRQQTEQLTILQQQLFESEATHRRSVEEISQRFARSVTRCRDAACQTDSSDKRYRELFEHLLTDLRKETEAVVNKKLAIIEEAHKQETINARRMLESNEQFLKRCRHVINVGKRGAIQDFHSSI